MDPRTCDNVAVLLEMAGAIVPRDPRAGEKRACLLDLYLSVLDCDVGMGGKHYETAIEAPDVYAGVRAEIRDAAEAIPRLSAFILGMPTHHASEETPAWLVEMAAMMHASKRGLDIAQRRAFLWAIYDIADSHAGCLDNGRHIPSAGDMKHIQQALAGSGSG